MGFFKNEVAKKELKDLLEIHPYIKPYKKTAIPLG